MEVSVSLAIAFHKILFVVCDLNACYFLPDLLTGPFLNIIIFLDSLASYQYHEVLVPAKHEVYNCSRSRQSDGIRFFTYLLFLIAITRLICHEPTLFVS